MLHKVHADMLYLIACNLNNENPSKEFLMKYEENGDGIGVKYEENGDKLGVKEENGGSLGILYQQSVAHFLDVLIGMTLEEHGISLPKEWKERIAKSVRKDLLFQIEREQILSFMEAEGIWYLPLKGIYLRNDYPSTTMRQMSDNDILFDEKHASEMKKFMVSRGYRAVEVGTSNHDVYQKNPVYNFEMHRALYDGSHQKGWDEYYKNIKERLILDEGKKYGYHMSEEDFYVYIVSHMYKHYSGSGTGLRSLTDIYVYLKKREEKMDFALIERECQKLGIAEFEKKHRSLCKKIFSKDAIEAYENGTLENLLSEEEQELLCFYASSGVYGTMEQLVENRMKKQKEEYGETSKFRYLIQRLFPPVEFYRHYPFFYKHKILLPVAWVYRLLRMAFVKERRKKMFREVNIVKKTADD